MNTVCKVFVHLTTVDVDIVEQIHTLLTFRPSGHEGGGACAPPAAGSSRKQELWTQKYDPLLDLDTCLTPEAQNWTDMICRV